MTWPALVALAAGAYGLKLLGVTVLGSGPTAQRLRPVTALVPAALFTGLVVALSVDGGASTPSRLAGVAVAVIAAWRKAPFVVVVLAAMATTAILRTL